MAVGVDEARRHHAPPRFDGTARTCLREVAEGDDLAGFDGDVGVESGAAAAVHDLTAADQDVMHGVASSLVL